MCAPQSRQNKSDDPLLIWLTGELILRYLRHIMDSCARSAAASGAHDPQTLAVPTCSVPSLQAGLGVRPSSLPGWVRYSAAVFENPAYMRRAVVAGRHKLHACFYFVYLHEKTNQHGQHELGAIPGLELIANAASLYSRV